MRIILVAILALSLNACATITGNRSPMRMTAQNADCKFEYESQGSGAVYPQGIKWDVCGQTIIIPEIGQGEDRSGVLKTLLEKLMGFLL